MAGASGRGGSPPPTALGAAVFSRRRPPPWTAYNSSCTPAPGLPQVVSRTWVLSLPMAFPICRYVRNHIPVRVRSYIMQDMTTTYDNYPRDMAGYGRTPPHPQWPGQARIALQ